jgi:hypothetical protein
MQRGHLTVEIGQHSQEKCYDQQPYNRQRSPTAQRVKRVSHWVPTSQSGKPHRASQFPPIRQKQRVPTRFLRLIPHSAITFLQVPSLPIETFPFPPRLIAFLPRIPPLLLRIPPFIPRRTPFPPQIPSLRLRLPPFPPALTPFHFRIPPFTSRNSAVIFDLFAIDPLNSAMIFRIPP